MKKIRLVYPQWQGGDIARWIPEIKDESESARGYMLGSMLLDYLSPTEDERYIIPVSERYERRIEDGVLDKGDIIRQMDAAFSIMDSADPDKIVTLGGECSVSVAPFTYLAKRYEGDVSVIWLDAHPDITLPEDSYHGFHAMAVTALMGYGDKDIVSHLPSRIDPSDILYVGLRDWERDEIRKRHEGYKIAYLAPEEVRLDSRRVISWLEKRGRKKVLIHFDMDVLDPDDIVAAVGTVEGGLSLECVVRLINDIAGTSDIAALTIAEGMPRVAIRLREMMRRLPLV